MNKTHRSIYCISTGTWTAVSELVSSKTSGLTPQASQGCLAANLPVAAVAISAALSLSPVAQAADLIFENTGNRTITIGLENNTSVGTTRATNTATGSLVVNANHGIFVSGSDDGFAQSLVAINNGSISITGPGAGIRVETTQATDTIQVTNTGTIVTTGGGGAYGISTYSAGTGNTQITSSGGISTQGTGETAIQGVSSGGGALNILNSGAIETLGTQSSGIYASNSGAGISIVNTSSITTREERATGIYALALNGGISLTNQGTITTEKLNSTGIHVIGHGTNAAANIEVNNSGSIFTSGSDSNGILVTSATPGSNTQINNTGLIRTSGAASRGIQSNNQAVNATVTITNAGAIVSVGTSGAAGIFAQVYAPSANSVINNSGSISTSGPNSPGIEARASQGGTVSITSSGQIMTTGVNGYGINMGSSSGGGAMAVLLTGGGGIQTRGDASAGIKFASNSQVTAYQLSTSNSSSITTEGDGSPGIWVVASPLGAPQGTITVDHAGSISTRGSLGCDLLTPSGGCLAILSSHGIMSASTGQVQITSSGQINVSGQNADGVHMRDKVPTASSGISGALAGLHDMRVVGGSITGGWGTGAGIRTANAQAASISISSGASVGALSDLAIRDADPGSNTLSGATQIVNNGLITGYVELVGANDTFLNDSTGVLNLRNHADTNGDGVRDQKSVSITDLGGIAELVNRGQIQVATVQGSDGIEEARIRGLGTLTNAGGVITMGDATTGGSTAIAGDTLKIEGHYVGSSYAGRQANVVLDTQLGGDSSSTDRLHITGNTSGTTRVTVNNAGGTGAATVNGIEVIRVDGTSNAGSFYLSAPVQAGAYEYNLFQGQPSSAADPDTNNDWYLRSGYKPIASGSGAGITTTPEPAAVTTSPASTPIATPVGGSTPAIAYRPAIPGYSLGPQNQAETVFDMMGQFHQRIGQDSDYFVARTSVPSTGGASANSTEAALDDASAWARVGLRNLKISGKTRFVSDSNVSLLQFGGTLLKPDAPSQKAQLETRHYTGWTFSLLREANQYKDEARREAGVSVETGKLNGSTDSVGVTHTQLFGDGRYLDVLVNVNRYSNTYRDVYDGVANQRGMGLSASFETGWKQPLAGTAWQIEPQAQLQWQSNRYKAFTDSVSTVSAHTNQYARARVGLRVASPSPSTPSKVGHNSFYITADLLNDLMKPNGINVADIDVPSDYDRQTWAELGIGGRLSVSENSWLYGAVQRQQGIGSSAKKRSGTTVNVGINVKW